MKKYAFLLLCGSVLLVGAGCTSSAPSAAPAPQPAAPQTQPPTPTPAPAPAPAPAPSPKPAPAPAPAPAPSGNKDVSISGFAFLSASVTVKAGATVVWTNRDPMAHTVTADDGSFDSGPIAPGATYSHAFVKAGSVSYHCSIHPSMHATVIVQ